MHFLLRSLNSSLNIPSWRSKALPHRQGAHRLLASAQSGGVRRVGVSEWYTSALRAPPRRARAPATTGGGSAGPAGAAMQPHGQDDDAAPSHTQPQPLASPPAGSAFAPGHASDAELAMLLAQRRSGAAPGPQPGSLAQLQQQLLAHLLQSQMPSPLEQAQHLHQQQQQHYLPPGVPPLTTGPSPGSAVLSALQQHLGLVSTADPAPPLVLRDNSSEEVFFSLGPTGLKVRPDERWGGWGGGLLPPPAAAAGPPLQLQPLSNRENSSEEMFFSLGPTGLKIRVVCNDVRGILYLDDQYVSCFCPDCEARVRAGHDRPIFGLSRFEKHCGSKAKKWRTSLRVEPGSCPEVRPQDAPMPVGQYLSLKGVGLKTKGGRDGNDSDQEFPRPKKPRVQVLPDMRMTDGRELAHPREGSGSPDPPLDRTNTGSVAAALMHLRQEAGAGEAPLPPPSKEAAGTAVGAQAPRSPHRPQAAGGAFAPLAGQGPSAASLSALMGGPAGSTPKDPALGRGGTSASAAAAAAAAFKAPAADGAAIGWQGSVALPEVVVVLDNGSPVTQGWMQQQRQRFEGLAARQEGPEPGAAGTDAGLTPQALSAKHAAIFRLVFGLLQGPNQSIFNEYYMPWLNDLPPERLDREFGSFTSYLGMLEDMQWQDVWRQIMAYLQGSLRRINFMQPSQPPPPAQADALAGKPPASQPVRQPSGGDSGGANGDSASKIEPVLKQDAEGGVGAGPAQERGAPPAEQRQQQPGVAGGIEAPSARLAQSPSFTALQEYLAKMKGPQAQQWGPHPLQAQQQSGPMQGGALSPRKDSATSVPVRGPSGGGRGSGGVGPLAAASGARSTAFQPYSDSAFSQPSVQQQQPLLLSGGGGGGVAESIMQRLAQMQRSSSGPYSPQVTPKGGEAAISTLRAASTPSTGILDQRAAPLIPQELGGVIAALRGIQQRHQQQQAQGAAGQGLPGGGTTASTSSLHMAAAARPGTFSPSPWASVAASDAGAGAAASALRAQLIWARDGGGPGAKGHADIPPRGGSPAAPGGEGLQRLPLQQSQPQEVGRAAALALPPGEPMEGVVASRAGEPHAGGDRKEDSQAGSESTQSEGAPRQQPVRPVPTPFAAARKETPPGEQQPSKHGGAGAAASMAVAALGRAMLVQKQGSDGGGLPPASPSGSGGGGLGAGLGFGSVVLPWGEVSGGLSGNSMGSGALEGANVASARATIISSASARPLEPGPKAAAAAKVAPAAAGGRELGAGAVVAMPAEAAASATAEAAAGKEAGEGEAAAVEEVGRRRGQRGP